MATKKSVKKISVKKVIVKTDGCPCGCDCCAAGDSVKYTSIWAAWRAFWRRGFTEWAGTSSRSEYWLAWVGNILALLIGALITMVLAALEIAVFKHAGFLAWLSGSFVVLYMLAGIIPAISMMTRRMHDAGLSAWIWLVYIFSVTPAYMGGEWIYAPSVGLIIALLPTQIRGNRFHKNNR